MGQRLEKIVGLKLLTSRKALHTCFLVFNLQSQLAIIIFELCVYS